MPKYRARPTEVDGQRFHSQGEARRYAELRLLEKAGEIMDLEIQPPFPLYIADRYLDGVEHYICTYVADFLYTKKDGEIVCEDFKGFSTSTYRLKVKLVEASYGITVTEIR